MLISDKYRELNAELHHARPSFGGSGNRYAKEVLEFARQVNAVSILDYGCGKGALAPELAGYTVTEYDPCITDKAALPEPSELVVCSDVLEHIEPECLDDVLAHIASLGTRGYYFVITTRPANKRLSDGRNAHLIQKGAAYWQKDIQKYMRIVRGHIDEVDHRYTVRAIPLGIEQ